MSNSSNPKIDIQVIDTTDSSSEQTETDNNSNSVSTPPKKSSSKRLLLIIGGAVLLVVVGIIGARYGLYALSHESTDNAYVEGHITAISPKVIGHVVKVYVNDNQLVKKG